MTTDTTNTERLVAALKDVLASIANKCPPCQGGLVHRCICLDCATERARAALAEAKPGPVSTRLVGALKFYADKDHLMIADHDAWDTVSGEPENYLCDDAGTATVEDGSVARAALAEAEAAPRDSERWSTSNANSGHGHVHPRPDGRKARCGGPAFCAVCELDLAEAEGQAAPQGWKRMKTAPKDGTTVLVLTEGSDVPKAVRWCEADHFLATSGVGWYMTWDGTKIQPHDGPRYWMHCPDDPDESPEAAAPEAPAAPRERLTDDWIDRTIATERDELLDHIYEYGTNSEGVMRIARKLVRTAIERAHGIGTDREGG